ncbi:MAG: primosomal protein N', partial [Pontibacterium sp.]
VAGRAGREEKSGKALLQTMHTDHPALLALVHQGYPAFAQTALIERKQMTLPPYSHYALLRAEASSPYIAERFLQDLRHTIEAQYVLPEQTHWLGPLPSPLERRAGMHRAQLIIYGQARKPLHQLLATLVEYLEHLPEARKIRWSLDIDPADTY